LYDDRRIRIRIREAKKHVDPVDPDPQHCFYQLFFFVQALVQLVKDDLKDLDTMLKGLAAVEK
jgi:hypothetical protein